MSPWVRLADAGVRFARWCLHRAGYRLSWQVSANTKPVRTVVRLVPQVMDLVCRNCLEVEYLHTTSGVEALDRKCGACGAQQWRVKPHFTIEHTASRKVDP